jgi:hypothetical protein
MRVENKEIFAVWVVLSRRKKDGVRREREVK